MVDVVTEPKFTLVGDGANSPWPTPVPLTAIDAEAVFLLPFAELPETLIKTEPVTVPVADGAKTTDKASDCPGASELDMPTPETLKPCGTLMFVMLRVVLLLFVRLAACVAVLPTTTLPKFMDVGVTKICSAGFGGEDRRLVSRDCAELATLIATRTTIQRQFPRQRGLSSFIGGTSTGKLV